MISSITSGLSAILGWFGDVVNSLFGTSGELASLLPAVGLAVSFGIVFSGIKLIKSVIKGY